MCLREPTFPVTVTISGTVKDEKGRPAANTDVSIRSQSITGAPGVDFSKQATTDENGEYRTITLKGTAYQLIFSPHTPPPRWATMFSA